MNIAFEALPKDWQLYIRGLEKAIGIFEDDLRDRRRGLRAQAQEHPEAADWAFLLADLNSLQGQTQTLSIDEIREQMNTP